MEMSSKEFQDLLASMDRLNLMSNGALMEGKFKVLLENIDLLKSMYEQYKILVSTNKFKENTPAYHAKHGCVLVSLVRYGIEDNKFTTYKVRIITSKGETHEVPYKELVPYNEFTDTLYAK